jgi:hypothetical protein
MPPDEMESTLRELFDRTIESYRGSPGMQCILLSMAQGDIRYMESDNADLAMRLWTEWMDAAGVQPWDISEDELGKASKIVYGREDAFV